MSIFDESKVELNNFLYLLLKALTDSIKDVKSELPKVAHEIVLYEGIVGGLVGVLQCSLVMAGLAAVSYWIQAYHPDYWGLHIATVLGEVLAGASLVSEALSAIKAKLAPRLFLLNYVVNRVTPKETSK